MTLLTVPRRTYRRTAGVFFLAAALVALVGCGAADPTVRPLPTSPFSPYVALGDSYTAVSGIDAEVGDACLRSTTAYPNLVAEELGIADVTMAACGGATTANLSTTQYPLNRGRNEPQLDALDESTKLVTVGIGLNDEAYSTLTLVSCFLIKGKQQSTCAPYLARPDSELDDLVALIGRNVATAIDKIQAAAPNARVIFVGYPRLLAPQSDCDSQVPLAPKALERVRTSGKDVNETLKQVAREAGIDFVDMYAASAGHDVCSDDPWVSGQRAANGQAFPFHPFQGYHVAVAEKIAALLASP